MAQKLTIEVTLNQIHIQDTVGGIVNIGQSVQRRVQSRDPNVYMEVSGSARGTPLHRGRSIRQHDDPGQREQGYRR